MLEATPKCPSVNEWIKKLWYIYTVEYYATERRSSHPLRQHGCGSGEHYAKWNKPGSERQIPYDVTYKWKLIKKTSKQNITRDIKIKNKLTLTRGEVEGDNRGQRGKCCQGRCIRDTWTKPKGGRIKGGRWRSLGCGGVVGWKWRQVYLNNNKKNRRILIMDEQKKVKVNFKPTVRYCSPRH